jgi:hypothetical protein
VNEQGLTHQVARQASDDFDRVVRGADFDVPRVWPAWTGELDHPARHAEHEHFGLDRPGGVKYRDGAAGFVQMGRALAATSPGEAFML